MLYVSEKWLMFFLLYIDDKFIAAFNTGSVIFHNFFHHFGFNIWRQENIEIGGF